MLGSDWRWREHTVLECYVDVGRHWPRGLQRRVVGCSALILDASERRSCERKWSQQLLRHELPALSLDSWPELVKGRRWDMDQRGQVLSDFAKIVEQHSVVGFYAAMETSVWRGLDQRKRRVFRSAEAFCFLRLLRLIVDRLEATSQTAPVQLVLATGAEGLVAGADLLAMAYGMDSRASDRLGDVRFCDPRKSTFSQIVELMTGRLRSELSERSGAAAREPGWLKSVGDIGAGAGMIGEFWDAAHCARYLASVDWDVPDQRSGGRRRS